MPHPTKRYETRWLRPEYQDRQAELISVAEIAQMARADRKVVGAWIMRYHHFPAPVKEVLTGRAPTKYFVAGEIAAWLLQHRPEGRKYEGARLQAYTLEIDAEIDRLDQQMAHLQSIRDQIRAAIDGRDTAS